MTPRMSLLGFFCLHFKGPLWPKEMMLSQNIKLDRIQMSDATTTLIHCDLIVFTYNERPWSLLTKIGQKSCGESNCKSSRFPETSRNSMDFMQLEYSICDIFLNKHHHPLSCKHMQTHFADLLSLLLLIEECAGGVL